MDRKRESSLYCLLPTGAAGEKVRGISHLFEHIMISKLHHDHNPLIASGHTTEDYVILSCKGITSREIINTLQQMKFKGEEVDRHKGVLIKEIERESVNDEEAFFRFLWQNTSYEKSPLGTVEDVAIITSGMLETMRLELLEKPLFFYSDAADLEISNGNGQSPPSMPVLNISWLRNKTFRDRSYDICYFNRSIEAYYLLTRILKDLNPDKHIQLSEKKDVSALILETGTRFPTSSNIDSLRENACREIGSDLSEIRSNIAERALNELESVYFYGKRWQRRIRQLFQTGDRQLLNLL